MEFVLEEAREPTVVLSENGKGLLSPTQHLTDDGVATLCGRRTRLVPVVTTDPDAKECKRCQSAKEGQTRIKRLFR